MVLNNKQLQDVKTLIEKAKQTEYKEFNAKVASAVNELKNGEKTEEQAYNKILKKVVKNEHHLIKRYANIEDSKVMNTLAEVYTDNKLEKLDFENLETVIKEEVYKISGIQS